MQNCETKCLESLVGIKSLCPDSANCAPYFIDDLEGIDMVGLANYANSVQITGEQYAKDLINTSARLMLGDLQGLISAGYSLADGLGELCSTCTFVPVYQVAGGVKVTRTVASKYAVMKISKIEVLANVSGLQYLVINDGQTVKSFPFTALGANTVVPLALNYETKQPSVKIYLQDATVAVGQVLCSKTSGCGCSGGSAPVDTPVQFSGLIQQMDSGLQYGFKVCANVSCSTEILTCSLMEQTPNLFGLTLLYRVGLQYFGNAPFASRINKTVLRNNEELSLSMQQYYEGLYRERLAGSTKVKGVKEVISTYLKRSKDRCISCQPIVGVSYAGG
jgi:hypothetical protein